MQDKSSAAHTIFVLGAGSIGVSFAATFADCGANVCLIDPDAERRSGVQAMLAMQQDAITTAGLARNHGGTVTTAASAGEGLASADLVLECGPENLSIKQAIFADLLGKTAPTTILATASSAITISRIVPDEHDQHRCLVAHPVNPPSVLRVIEIVPAPGTDHAIADAASRLFRSTGFETVALDHEIEGFVLNRLQGAVLREAYRLIDEGVTDVAGIEAIMRMGLGPRWALSGPFETAELNTPGGIKAHAARMGPAYKRIGEARGETVEWSDALVESVDTQRRKAVPAEKLADRAKWRAQAVAHLVAARDKLMQD